MEPVVDPPDRLLDQCQTLGCTERSMILGHCQQHSRCKEDGCDKHVAARGYCKSHAQDRGYLHRGRKVCSHRGNGTPEEECKRLAASKGLCRQHGGGTRCSIAECQKFAVRMGFCKAHAKENGIDLPEYDMRQIREKSVCTHVGPDEVRCQKLAVSKKLCSTHGGKKRCKDVSDGEACKKHVFTGGYCLGHARKNGLQHSDDTKRRCKWRNPDNNDRCTSFTETGGLCFTHGTRKKCPFELEGGRGKCGKRSIVEEYCISHAKIALPQGSAAILQLQQHQQQQQAREQQQQQLEQADIGQNHMYSQPEEHQQRLAEAEAEHGQVPVPDPPLPPHDQFGGVLLEHP